LERTKVSTTRLTVHLNAPPAKVYRALTTAAGVEAWMVPDGMTSRVSEFEPREGGSFRISLTYEDKSAQGKSEEHTDTHRGTFVKLVPNELVVQTTEFETSDPSMKGEMKLTLALKSLDGGTELAATHENVPPGIRPEDNELGWRLSLEKLRKLVEAKP
jgi:uncharacterized protein YndB with AHSA1/START domain